MRLYRVDIGVKYWIITRGEALTPEAAMEDLEEVEGPMFGEGGLDPIKVSDIREYTEQQARMLVCEGEGMPDTDLWSAAEESLRANEPVVASSEGP